jgi:outer membrane protein assembly factor BamD (BamD/ComL family)
MFIAVIPAQAGIHVDLALFYLERKKWIPACAGMTTLLIEAPATTAESYSAR